jgi:hypothetical protein
MHLRRSTIAAVALAVLLAAALTAAVVPPRASATDYSPPPGTLLWLQTWHPSSTFMKYGERDLVRGPGGDIWLGISGSTRAMDSPYTKRICVARYSPSGAPRWRKVLPSPVDMERYCGIALDRGRNAVVVGYREASGSPWVVRKLSPSGKTLWTRVISFADHAQAVSVALDSHGDIYVVGTVRRTATGDDLTLVKFTASGVRKWTRSISGYEASWDSGVDVAVDSKDRVYVTGTVGSLMSGTDVVIARYTVSGTQVWLRTWDGAGLDDTAVDLDVSATTVAVAANAAGSTVGTAAVLKAVPDMTGKTIEARTAAYVGRSAAWSAVDVNAAGDIAAVGTLRSGTIPEYMIQGRWSTFWTTSSYAPAGGTAGGDSVAVMADGTVIAGGWETGNGMVIDADLKEGEDWRANPFVGVSAERIVATSGGVYAFGEWGDFLLLLKVAM